MITESQIQTLIFAHAALGGLALCTGLIPLITKKGGTAHKKSGRVFFYSLLGSALMALLISCLANHKSSFLFAIGVFSIYLTLGGFRAVSFKKKQHNFFIDILLAWIMLAMGASMILYPLIVSGAINIVLSVFGTIGALFAIQDLRAFKDNDSLRKKWLSIHLNKMVGAYIASFTAFIVVNRFIPGIYGWLAPSFFGTLYIIYQSRKIRS